MLHSSVYFHFTDHGQLATTKAKTFLYYSNIAVLVSHSWTPTDRVVIDWKYLKLHKTNRNQFSFIIVYWILYICTTIYSTHHSTLKWNRNVTACKYNLSNIISFIYYVCNHFSIICSFPQSSSCSVPPSYTIIANHNISTLYQYWVDSNFYPTHYTSIQVNLYKTNQNQFSFIMIYWNKFILQYSPQPPEMK